MDMFIFVTTATMYDYSQSSVRKTHIINEDGKCLCGCHVAGIPTEQVTKEWLEQPDYYDEVCKTCKKIAKSKLEVKQ